MLIRSQREALKELEELFAEDEMNFPEEKDHSE
jgi:glutathione-regulated potassium-efflux system ancillary protein KefC/glutathione-regulated potassium-efflux system protein KefB